MLGFTTFLLPILPAPSEKTSPILLFSTYSQHPFPEKVKGPLSTSAMTPTFLPNSSAHPFQASYGEVSHVTLYRTYPHFLGVGIFAGIFLLPWARFIAPLSPV